MKKMTDYLDPAGLKKESEGLDADEKTGLEFFAHEEPEVSEALLSWGILSMRGRTERSDQAFLDRLQYLLQRAVAQQNLKEEEGLEGDEHENLGVGA